MERQHELIGLIVERVYAEGDDVVAMTLKADDHLVLGHETEEPTYVEVDPLVHVRALRGWNTHVSKLRVAFVPGWVLVELVKP